MRRREFIRNSGGVMFIGPFSSESGEEIEVADNGNPVTPDHITEVRDDLEELRRFQPKLFYDHLNFAERSQAQRDLRGMFGWTLESSEHDVTAHYYWVRSNTQRSSLYYLGIDWGPDQHYLDHEPIIVFRRDDNTIDSVVTTGGHHFALYIDGEYGPVTEDRVDGVRTHVNLLVVRPHNHYMEAPSGEEGQFVQDFAEFGSWLDEWQSWNDNGRYDGKEPGAIVDPFAFYDEERQHWWRDGTRDAWFAKNVWIPLGLTEGQSRQRLDYERDDDDE